MSQHDSTYDSSARSATATPDASVSLAALQEQVRGLRRRTRALELLAGVAVLALVLVAARGPAAAEVLRARGLVLEDDQGRARLLLGVNVPEVAERLRKDPAAGLVLLDEQGHDRLQMGHVGGPQMGGTLQERISPATGLSVNDAAGDERGGFGLMDNGRAVMGLDAPSGEGVMLFVAPDLGMNGLMINSHTGDQTTQRISLAAKATGEAALSFNDTVGRTRAVLRCNDGAPALEALDADGRPLFNLMDGAR